MIKLGFFIHFNKTWLGGINVILNLINLISEKTNDKIASKIKIIIFTNSKKKLRKFNINKKVEIIENNEIFDINIFLRIIDKIYLVFFGKTIFFEKFLTKYKLSFISHTTLICGKNSCSKSIIWIPDFQYLHLPQLFSLRYKILKFINLRLYIKHAYKILLSSYASKKDLIKNYRIDDRQIIVNKFYFNIPSKNKLKKFIYLKKKYGLPKKYFYLPNQYWVHKNHKVVIDALKSIINDNKKSTIYIYSTGTKSDHRNPNHFLKLMKEIRENNLKNNFKYLGLVPYLDAMSLIYYSTAVINPSFFEGWSSTVEQANAFNKVLILSNIDVHKEQKPHKAIFFNPRNMNSLKKILLDFESLKKSRKITKNKKIKLKVKVSKYTEDYLDIFNKYLQLK